MTWGQPEPEGWVYFIHAVGTPFTKVGWSIKSDFRVRQLQTGCPYELELLRETPCQFEDERELHSILTALGRHERLEWFRMTREEAEAIDFDGFKWSAPWFTQ